MTRLLKSRITLSAVCKHTTSVWYTRVLCCSSVRLCHNLISLGQTQGIKCIRMHNCLVNKDSHNFYARIFFWKGLSPSPLAYLLTWCMACWCNSECGVNLLNIHSSWVLLKFYDSILILLALLWPRPIFPFCSGYLECCELAAFILYNQ